MEATRRLRQAGGGGALAGLPIGFRFRPTDEELLLHYLRRKALGCPLPADIIPVADLARLHPWDLVPPGTPSLSLLSLFRPHVPCSIGFRAHVRLRVALALPLN
jgi:hypothetical protein